MSGAHQDFRPIEGLGKWVMRLCFVTAAAEILFAASEFYVLQFVNDYNAGVFDTLTDLEWNAMAIQFDTIATISGFGYLGILIVVYLTGGVWIYRAAKNASLIDPYEKRIKPGWAVGWFFVPIVNYWMPFKAMRQTWHTSMGEFGGVRDKTPFLLTFWWGAWVLQGILGQVSSRLTRNAELSDLDVPAIMNLITAPISLIAIYGFYQIVKQVTAAQADGVSAAMERVFE